MTKNKKNQKERAAFIEDGSKKLDPCTEQCPKAKEAPRQNRHVSIPRAEQPEESYRNVKLSRVGVQLKKCVYVREAHLH